MAISGVVIRRRVDDLDSAVAFYERLCGRAARRFGLRGAELATVGPFLLFSAPEHVGDRLENVAATLTVDDLVAHEALLRSLGAQIIAPIAETPNGRRLVARHPDGAVFEYVGR
ncbi:MAG: VOC family protein [Solirubrobacterales bacterium]|nr:VOC family protein [Solirubrobacterales bacterium]